MERREVRTLAPGLYQIYWKRGGSSLAAVGMLPDGGRWLAPVNWVHPTENQRDWRLVESVHAYTSMRRS